MANRAKAKQRKGANGTGASLTVYFDISDPAERKALEAARLLAAKHGRRKQAIIALLEAVYNQYEATGDLLSSAEITAALIGSTAPGRPAMGFTSVVATGHGLQLSTEGIPQQRSGGVEVSDGSKISAQEVANNFLRSMSGFLD